MSTRRDTPEQPLTGLDGQCCSCQNWNPYPDDAEIGRCQLKPMKSMEPITFWSDGCKDWRTNRE